MNQEVNPIADTKEVFTPQEVVESAEIIHNRVRPIVTETGRTQIKTPDSIIADLERISALAADNVTVLMEADRTRKNAQKELAVAQSKALSKATGKTVPEREAEVLLATVAERDAADEAEIAYRYAQRIADLVESRKSVLQTQAKQVEITYHLAHFSGRQKSF